MAKIPHDTSMGDAHAHPAEASRTSSGKADPSTQPAAATPPPRELNQETGVTNTPNPALPADTDVGTLEQPRNTGSGDTPAPSSGGSAPGPQDKDGKDIPTVDTIGTGPYPKDGSLPTQAELPDTPSEST